MSSSNVILKLLILVFAIFVLWWGTGLIRFIMALPEPVPAGTDVAEGRAVIVLTGGKGRIDTAWALVEERPDLTMFITGVHGDVDIDQLIELDEDARERVQIGRMASNTRENALEADDWFREHPAAGIVLVTSHYHMPRAMLAFREVFGEEIEITPYPVVSDNFASDDGIGIGRGFRNFGIYLSEYCKWLIDRLDYSLSGGMAVSFSRPL